MRKAVLLVAVLLAAAVAIGVAVEVRRRRHPPAPLVPGPLQDPEGLAVDAQGTIYVADEDAHAIVAFGPEGRERARLTTLEALPGGLVTTGGSIAVLESGRVLAIRYRELVELRLSDGRFELVRVVAGALPEPLHSPEGVAVARDGRIYIADEDGSRVVVLDAGGAQLATWPVDGKPEGICAFEDRVYVTYSKAHWVGCYDRATGALRFRFGTHGGGPGELDTPDFVAVSPDRLLYVTDQGNDRLCVFDLDGRFRTAIGGTGTEPGRFRRPEDLAFGPDGRLWVADGGNHRLQVLAADGRPLGTIP